MNSLPPASVRPVLKIDQSVNSHNPTADCGPKLTSSRNFRETSTSAGSCALARRGVLVLAGSAASSTAIARLARPASQRNAITADEDTLRAYGAQLDGVADDLPAITRIIADATAKAEQGVVPSIVFDFPAGRILLSGPPQSGACNVTIRGAGQNVTFLVMRSGGDGLWIHGTPEKPAIGYLQLSDISLIDSNATGSGCLGLSIRFAADAPQPAMTWQGVAFRKWTRPIAVVNLPRNWHCENVTVFGPDFAMQAHAAFEIASTPDFTQGCFGYAFSNVFVANYAWGWHYDIQAPLEGQRFHACTCYNGWGMIRAYCHGGTGLGQVGPNYKSLLWYIVDCDWQGLGYGLDLVAIRNVMVDRGYFIADALTNPLDAPPAPGSSLARERRRYFSFVGCDDVVLRDVRLDVLDRGIEPSLALVFVDEGCKLFRAYNTHVVSFSRIHAGFEFASAPNPNSLANTMGEFDTKWQAWKGGDKVLDPGCNQIEQSTLRDLGIGDVSPDGRITLQLQDIAVHPGSTRIVTVRFPLRPGGKPYFLKGAPVISYSVSGPIGTPASIIIDKSSLGFVLGWPNLDPATTLRIDYRATGI